MKGTVTIIGACSLTKARLINQEKGLGTGPTSLMHSTSRSKDLISLCFVVVTRAIKQKKS